MAKQQEKCSTDERGASEKLRLILEANRLDDAELGEFLRREGIKEGDLERWQEEALSGLQAAPSRAVDERRIRELERETTRQKKRLREAEALLELQKKSKRCGRTKATTPPAAESFYHCPDSGGQ